MKRCALVVSDDSSFSSWIGCHITTVWPKMVLEEVSVKGAAMTLDRIELSRYQVIVARFNFDSVACLDACIFLMRILKRANRPDVIVIGDDIGKLNAARTTNLREAVCIPGNELTSRLMGGLLADIKRRNELNGAACSDGAPNIANYRIKKPIAGTFSATIYQAYSEARREDVVLKIGELYTDHAIASANQSLRQEFYTMRKLAGPRVARAYEYFEHEGLGCIAMEYFPRGTLGGLFATSGRGASRVEYLLEVARALRDVHAGGFLHLDLKPNNVMVRNDGSIALIDFGISKRILAAKYQRGLSYSMGSPYFMSPEQLRGEALDERSEVYSFGVFFYRIFTGRMPLSGRTIDQIRNARATHVIPKLGGVLHHYQPIIDGTLSPHPEQRFASFDEVIENIEYQRDSATGVFRQLDASKVAVLEQQAGMSCSNVVT